MARIDFSNARLEFITDGTQSGGGNKTYTTYYGRPLGVKSASFAKTLNTYNLDSIATVGKSILMDTPTKWVCNYAGTFTQSGDTIYIADANTQGYMYWGVLKITNIPTFDVGDDFDFNIEITYSGD